MKTYTRDNKTLEIPEFTVTEQDDKVVFTILEGEYTNISYTYGNIAFDNDMITYNLEILSDNSSTTDDITKITENILTHVLYEIVDNMKETENEE